jgi:hypothetical protein
LYPSRVLPGLPACTPNLERLNIVFYAESHFTRGNDSILLRLTAGRNTKSNDVKLRNHVRSDAEALIQTKVFDSLQNAIADDEPTALPLEKFYSLPSFSFHVSFFAANSGRV